MIFFFLKWVLLCNPFSVIYLNAVQTTHFHMHYSPFETVFNKTFATHLMDLFQNCNVDDVNKHSYSFIT